MVDVIWGLGIIAIAVVAMMSAVWLIDRAYDRWGF